MFVHYAGRPRRSLAARRLDLGVLAGIAVAKEQHEATLVAVPSQTERLPVPWHFPCCGVKRGTARYWWRVLSNQCGC